MTKLFALALSASLAACSGATPPAASPKAAPPPPTKIAVPAGAYAMDANHASLSFSVKHLGLSNYVARFAKFDVDLMIDPEQLNASTVSVSIDPTSVRTDYPGDYKASHKKSPFSSWDEDLAQSPKFLNAAEHPEISFQSTSVEALTAGKLRINGNLTLRGITQPLTLEAMIVGSTEAHPFTSAPAIGFSAQGQFKRSAFGMDHLIKPGFVSDEVQLRFEGEFQKADAG